MVKVEYFENKSLLKISNFTGKFPFKRKINFNPKSNSIAEDWNFYRNGCNNFYILSENDPTLRNSKNNLIISSYPNILIENVENSFINVKEFEVYIAPITDVRSIISIGEDRLKHGIKYHKPQSVIKRECLSEKNLSELEQIISLEWDMDSTKIQPILNGKANNGIYLIETKEGKLFVLKYRGREKEKAEQLVHFLNLFPEYFPLSKLKKDLSGYVIKIDKELYGLEKYENNISPKKRDLEYLSLIGRHSATMHEKFQEILEKNSEFEKIFGSYDEFLNESNMLSFYFDLCFERNKLLSEELKKIIDGKFLGDIKSLHQCLIHRDLNHSNLMWNGNEIKVIDSESLGFSLRINEFVAPLLLGGNMAIPDYIQGGLRKIIESYNQFSRKFITEKEEEMLPGLLKYSLLKNYVVRKIRRNSPDYNGESIHINFQRINKDINHER